MSQPDRTMRKLAGQLREEGDELYRFLAGLEESDWVRQTPFNNWTVDEVMQHLNAGDVLAGLSLREPENFRAVLAARKAARTRGEGGFGLEGVGLENLHGPALLAQWRQHFQQLCNWFAEADARARIEWVGPDMSVRSSATARQMETWAHGQDIYDLMRQPRQATDRIHNLAVLGVNTFAWSFQNRGLPVPEDKPHVCLTGPSGAVWQWHDADQRNCVEGTAVDFCRVVTQGRNIADVDLSVTGETARRWMAVAQCFAGPPKDPPKPGKRTWN